MQHGHRGKIIELELDSDITSDYSNTDSLPFEAELDFIIQEEENILNINNSHGKINLQANEGIFNFAGNLTINAGNIIEVAKEHVDICSNKIILNGGVTGLTLTPDASIEAQHHEGASSYGTITYSGTHKEWNINPSINSTKHITTGTYLTVGTDLTVTNSATINNDLNVNNSATINNDLTITGNLYTGITTPFIIGTLDASLNLPRLGKVFVLMRSHTLTLEIDYANLTKNIVDQYFLFQIRDSGLDVRVINLPLHQTTRVMIQNLYQDITPTSSANSSSTTRTLSNHSSHSEIAGGILFIFSHTMTDLTNNDFNNIVTVGFASTLRNGFSN